MIFSFVHSLFSIEYGFRRSVLHRNPACSGVKKRKRPGIYILFHAFNDFGLQ